jgi:hypothetical protein
MKSLRISDDLSLPIEAVTQKLAFLGRTGGGKTYAATKLCELMLDAGAQVVALDPVGKWYGLRVGAQGYPVPVFGGLYGDVPLEPTAGAFMADLIVNRDISAVLDVSQFISSEQQRFASDFARRLFERRKEKPAAMHLFIEECQEFTPQNLPPSESGGHAKMMLHHFERLIKLGRNYGIGASLISQRPQEVNKKVLNQTEIMFAFQMTGPQERKAISTWVDDKGEDSSVVDTLPTLKQGEAHVWSPVFLQVSKVVHIAAKKTADVSATPKVGERATTAKELSRVDVEEIKSAMQATVEKAKENDPKILKAKIVELEKRLRSQSPIIDEQAIERAVASAVAARDREWSARTNRIEESFTEVKNRIEKIAALAQLNGHAELPPAPKATPALVVRPTQSRVAAIPRSAEVKAVAVVDGDAQPLGKCERAILTVLSQFPEGCDKDKLTLLAGYRYSGGFKNSLSALRQAVYMTGANTEVMRITEAGLTQGPFPALPTGPELATYWLNHNSFGKCERAILSMLLDNPAGMTAQSLCEATGYRYSGGFKNALSTLRTAGVLVGRNTEIMYASAELFD